MKGFFERAVGMLGFGLLPLPGLTIIGVACMFARHKIA